jgi:hypothetical protein
MYIRNHYLDANFARPQGAKDKKPRKRRRKNPLLSAAKGAALGAGVAGTALVGNQARKALALSSNRSMLGRVALDSLKSVGGSKKRLAALAGAGLLGAGAAYVRRSNKNIEQEQEDYENMGLIDRFNYDQRLKRQRRLKEERRQDFDRRKKDVMDVVDKGSRVSNNARGWVSTIGSGKRDWERIGISKASLEARVKAGEAANILKEKLAGMRSADINNQIASRDRIASEQSKTRQAIAEAQAAVRKASLSQKTDSDRQKLALAKEKLAFVKKQAERKNKREAAKNRKKKGEL